MKNIHAAIHHVQTVFPFDDYIQPRHDKYSKIGKIVQKYLKPGDRLLDFGSDPCDTTAVLQHLGFRCSAFDDLGDEWHQRSNNRQKIMDFAKAEGIDLRLAGDDYALPFEKNYFDMISIVDVLEHLHNSPRMLINDLVELLKPGGYLLAIVPNAANIKKRLKVLMGRTNLPSFEIYYWYPDPWRGHVREYVRDDFVQLARYCSMDIAELKSDDFMLSVLPTMLHIPYRLVTSIFTGWKDTWVMVAQKPDNWKAEREIPQDRLDHLMKSISL